MTPDAGAGHPAFQSLNLTSYVASLGADTRTQLYSSPWTCQAVFRALNPMAQQYVLRLLYTAEPIADGYVRNWAKSDATACSKHEAAMQLLRQLSLLSGEGRGGTSTWSLNSVFKQRLRSALSGGVQSGQDVDPVVLQVLPGQDVIADYAVKQWEGVLTFLLDPARQSPPSLPVGLRHDPLDVESLVSSAGLIDDRPRDRSLTGGGFRFLLMDTNSQLWVLLREYIRSAEQVSAAQLSSVLSFLMQLGFRQVGRPYPLAGLGALEQRIAAHMAQLGLLYTFKAEGGTYFCPTALASTLCGGGAAAAAALSPTGVSSSSGGGGGYVIVETNFRIYAYTSSRIQMRVLEEFCRMDCALPNLFVGTLTRDSVQRALSKGMTADDVIGFLQSHAHPQVAGRVPSVPETVQDQIRLWERETKRVDLSPGYWYSNFEDVALFERSRAFAQQRGVLLWDSAEKQQMVVSAQGHGAVKEHIRQLKAQAAMGAAL